MVSKSSVMSSSRISAIADNKLVSIEMNWVSFSRQAFSFQIEVSADGNMHEIELNENYNAASLKIIDVKNTAIFLIIFS